MNSKFLKVKDSENLIRDPLSGGILNISEPEYKRYKEEREIAKRKLDAEKHKENRINTLEQKVSSIESKLDRLLELITNGKS